MDKIMEDEKIEIPKMQGHNCFACGTANPIGLNLNFYCSGNSVCADIILGKYRVGWENMAHGGIISTLLDEVMSWTIIYFKKVFFVTRKMEIKYIKPVLINVPLTVKGRIKNEKKGRYIEAVAEVFNDKLEILARSKGQFVVLSKKELSLVPDNLKNEMSELFQKFPE